MGKSFSKSNNKNDIKCKQNPKRKGSGFRSSSDKFDNAGIGRDNVKLNDPSWYANHPQLLKDSASFPFGYALGNIIDMGKDASVDMNRHSVPGIMSIYLAPTIGESTSRNSAVNVAARNVYSFVRHANSGHTNYDSPDLMLYLLAMDSIYSYIAYLKRAYGCLLTYSYTNRYIAKALIEAMEIDYEDIQTHMADFRQMINTLVIKAGSLCVPSVFPYYQRHYTMYSDIYLDAPNSDKAQMYIYMPEGFYGFRYDDDGSGYLCPAPFTETVTTSSQITSHNAHLHTLAELVFFGNNLLNAILESEDMNIMSGDILKAYGEGGVYKLSMIDDNYIVMPKYSEEILDQINNATLCGRFFMPSLIGDNSIKQSGETTIGLPHDHLIATPHTAVITPDKYTSSASLQAYNANRIVNFEHGAVEAADTMVASRLTNIPHTSRIENNIAVETPDNAVVGTNKPWSAIWMTWKTVGAEIATFAKIYYFGRPAEPADNFATYYYASEDIYTAISTLIPTNTNSTELIKSAMSLMNDDFRRATFITVFNRHPRISQTIVGEGASDAIQINNCVGYLGDINYYTIINRENLIEMSAVAMLSLFNITQYGRTDSFGK